MPRPSTTLRQALEQALDPGRVLAVVQKLSDLAPQGRQRAWVQAAGRVFKQAAERRPSRARRTWTAERRLRHVFFAGDAAGTPERLRAAMDSVDAERQARQ